MMKLIIYEMIDLTVYWIAYELKTEEYEEIMKL